jgi:GWxTD domain-containing protein
MSVSIAARCAANVRPEDYPPVQQLLAELKQTGNRDSVRFLLAVAYRNTGSLEGRQRAIEIFDKIRPRYFKDPAYHLELGRTRIEAGKRSEARQSLEQAIKLSPDDPRIYLLCARMLFESVLRYGDDETAQQALRILEPALARQPDNRDLLYMKSTILALSHDLSPAGGIERSVAGRACTEAILAKDATDVPACLLNGVHCSNLNDQEYAGYSFRLGLGQASDELKAAYFAPTYSAPESVLISIVSLPLSDRVRVIQAYWDQCDPTPLTPVNETQIEYWKRMTLADLYFGEPPGDAASGVRGWETPRGETLVRYGAPQVMALNLASFRLGTADNALDMGLYLRKGTSMHNARAVTEPMALELRFPTQTWTYSLNGKQMQVSFVDNGLHGRFTPSEPEAFHELTRAVPYIAPGGFSGAFKQCFITSSGFRGKDRPETAQSIFIGIPAWAEGETWWANARCTVNMIDSTSSRSVVSSRMIEKGMVRRPASSGLAIVTTTASLNPGRYMIEVKLESGELRGSFTVPVDVRRFQRDDLQISDLCLAISESGAPAETGALAETGRELEAGASAGAAPEGAGLLDRVTPNPTGATLVGSTLDAYFEIYNLSRDGGGIAHYRTRYTVLPRDYVVEFARLSDAGSGQVDPELRWGGLGKSIGEVTLGQGNYCDAQFPQVDVRVESASRGIASVRVDTRGLAPGLYGLIVSVADLSSGKTAWVQAPLRILTEMDLRSYLRGR